MGYPLERWNAVVTIRPPSQKEARRVGLAVAITLLLSVYHLCVELIDQLRMLFKPFTDMPVAEWLTDGLFFWLLALLWLAYRNWRAALLKETELQRILSSISPDVLLVVTPDRTVTTCSTTVETMFGFKAEEVIGHKTDQLYQDRRVLGAREVHDRLDLLGFHMGCATGLRKNGVEFPLELVTSGLRGQPGALVLIRDVTERRRAEEELSKYQRRLEELVQERTAELCEANKQLRQELKERKRMEQEILEISHQERQRIGQDLHDTLGQHLTGLSFLGKVLERELEAKALPEAKSAAQITTLVAEAVSLARQIARGLAPVDLVEEGLSSALHRLAEDTNSMVETSCQVIADTDGVVVHDNGVATHLYRVAQEAINNALRHGEARQIRVSLTGDGTRGTLIVKDDGRGLQPNGDGRKGMGLRIMRYRADVIGGMLDIQGDPGGGTILTCSFENRPPLPAMQEKP